MDLSKVNPKKCKPITVKEMLLTDFQQGEEELKKMWRQPDLMTTLKKEEHDLFQKSLSHWGITYDLLHTIWNFEVTVWVFDGLATTL